MCGRVIQNSGRYDSFIDRMTEATAALTIIGPVERCAEPGPASQPVQSQNQWSFTQRERGDFHAVGFCQ
jgi:hypothetical protein